MNNDINTYLFDFDGTLVDSHDSLVRVFKGAYKAVGVDIDDEVVIHLMRTPLFVGYQELKAPLDKGEIFGKTIIKLLNDDITYKLTKEYDDVKPMLEALKKAGKTLGIVTSNNVKHVKDVLSFLNIDENLFSVYVGNEEVKRHKPNADPILKALEFLNISNKNVCYVGDAYDDIESATNAHVIPILLDRYNEYSDYKGQKIVSLSELI